MYQVGSRLLERGHVLHTNIPEESYDVKTLNDKDLANKGREIDVFYIRIDGSIEKDQLTLFRKINMNAPCIWEVNTPLEELLIHGTTRKNIEIYNIRRKILASMVDAAICVTKEIEEYSRSFLNIPKTCIIPNGSDPEMFTPDKRVVGKYGTQKFAVIWIGSVEYPWQGIEIFKRIAKKMREIDRDIIFIATAEGTVNDNVQYIGRIPYSQLPVYIASADLGFCVYDMNVYERKGLPFYWSPLKLYDYMACRLPVIGTNRGQITQVVKEHKSGLLTDNSDEDIIKKILLLKNNRHMAVELGNRGRRAVLAKFNWENVVLLTEKLIDEVRDLSGISSIHRKFKFLSGSIKYRVFPGKRTWM